MIVFLLFLNIFLFTTACYFAFKAYTFAKVILKIQDAIEESLEVLDERYKNIAEILQKPVFFDSLEVRQVIEEIGITRDTILFIANNLENSQRATIDDKNDDKEEKSSKEE